MLGTLIICIIVSLFHYRAFSWSHDAWALIALIALLSTILVLGNIYGVLVLLIRTCITRAPRAQVKIIFLQMLAMCQT